MSIKEDILEQLVQEYLLHMGYFVQCNVKYRPNPDHINYEKNKDSNHSDIDVLAFNPIEKNPARVVAVSCKSWQSGFKPAAEISAIDLNKKISGRVRWKPYRELVKPKWSEAFLRKIKETTGETEFTYVTAVTKIVGDKTIWEQHPLFQKNLKGNPIQVLDVSTMLSKVLPKLTTTMANTSIGRILQLIKASKYQLNA